MEMIMFSRHWEMEIKLYAFLAAKLPLSLHSKTITSNCLYGQSFHDHLVKIYVYNVLMRHYEKFPFRILRILRQSLSLEHQCTGCKMAEMVGIVKCPSETRHARKVSNARAASLADRLSIKQVHVKFWYKDSKDGKSSVLFLRNRYETSNTVQMVWWFSANKIYFNIV